MCVFVTRNVRPRISCRDRENSGRRKITGHNAALLLSFFRSSFTYKTYIPVIAYIIIISAIFFFLLFYRSRILSRILWRWSFYRLYAASPLGMPLRIRVGNSCRTHSAIRISWKNAGNIPRFASAETIFRDATNWCNANYGIVPNFGD